MEKIISCLLVYTILCSTYSSFYAGATNSVVSSDENLMGRPIENDLHILSSMSDNIALSSSQGHNRLEIFCYKGEQKSFSTILKTIELVVRVPKDNFRYYNGKNASVVRQEYAESSWFSFTPWRPSSFRLELYNFSCIGIESPETFRVFLKIRYLDLWRVLTLGTGIALFITAPILAQNVVFHYVTGISLGIFGSLLVIIFKLSRMVPQKTGALSFLVGGWGLVLYMIQFFWSHSLLLMQKYQTVVAGYILLAGLISFAIVYRWGPIKDEKTLKLVQWVLQLTALSAIFFSSQYSEFTLSVDLFLLTYQNIPTSFKFQLKTYWLKRFPPKQDFLSEEEYMEQSRIETKKGIDDLRKFCHSPNCNAWKTMSRLKSPHRFDELVASPSVKNRKLTQSQRFAEFVEGDSHLKDDEILSYESANYSPNSRHSDDLLTSDEDS